MSDQTRQQLQRAFQLIKSGQNQQAVDLITPILHADRDNADAWWLMAHAVENPQYKRQALQNVLRMRPNDDKARAMLEKIGAAAPPSQPKTPPPAPKPAPPQDDPFAALDTADDPFADPKNAIDPFADVKNVGGDPFVGLADTDDPFAYLNDEKPSKRTRKEPEYGVPREKKSTSSTQIVLITCGSIMLFACVVCGGLAIFGGPSIANQIDEMMTEIAPYITPNPNGGFSVDYNSSGSGGNLDGVIGDLNMKGNLSFNEPRRDTVVDAFDNHGYTFEGSAGDYVTIEVNATDGQLDPELALYGPDNQMVAQNDDVDFGSNNNSRVEVGLPSSGTYTVVVSGFASDGSYEVFMTH